MRVGSLVAAGAATLMAAGCAQTSSTPSASTGGAGAKIPAFAQGFEVPASGCGSYSAAMPADPDGVIAKLDAAHQDALRGYADFLGSTVKVLKSRWATWKPPHPGPYTIGISWGQLVSDFQKWADGLNTTLPRSGASGSPATTPCSSSPHSLAGRLLGPVNT